MHRPAPMLIALAAIHAATPVRAVQDGPATVVFLVRHAEKVAEPAVDPPLTPAGEARAAALADLLRDSPIQRVITTQFVRTRLTAAPAAARFGLEPVVVRASADVATHARDVADAIRAKPGMATLVVGHSNTLPAIIEALGAPLPAPIGDDDYGDLFVVILEAGRTPLVVRSRYGL